MTWRFSSTVRAEKGAASAARWRRTRLPGCSGRRSSSRKCSGSTRATRSASSRWRTSRRSSSGSGTPIARSAPRRRGARRTRSASRSRSCSTRTRSRSCRQERPPRRRRTRARSCRSTPLCPPYQGSTICSDARNALSASLPRHARASGARRKPTGGSRDSSPTTPRRCSRRAMRRARWPRSIARCRRIRSTSGRSSGRRGRRSRWRATVEATPAPRGRCSRTSCGGPSRS